MMWWWRGIVGHRASASIGFNLCVCTYSTLNVSVESYIKKHIPTERQIKENDDWLPLRILGLYQYGMNVGDTLLSLDDTVFEKK